MALSGNPVVLGGGAGMPSGASTVVGSAGSSTDNAVVRWDGTTGSLIQDSGATMDDNNVLTLARTTLGTTSSDGLIAINTTDAAAGAQQIGPRVGSWGEGWKTDATAGTVVVGSGFETLPVEGAAAPTLTMKFWSKIGAAAITYPMTLTSAGALTTLGAVISGDGTATAVGVGVGSAGSGFYEIDATTLGVGLNGAGEYYRFNTGYLQLSHQGATGLTAVGNGVLRLNSGSSGASFSRTYRGTEASATSVDKLQKAVASIADNTGTAVLTVTIPNAAHSASLKVRLAGSLGAGGAIGANEATGTVSYDFAIARTAGVNAVVTASSAYGSGMANVAGAATITVTAAASAISGAVGDPNTFTVNVTIARGSGSSANHTCMVLAELMNANASGISIA